RGGRRTDRNDHAARGGRARAGTSPEERLGVVRPDQGGADEQTQRERKLSHRFASRRDRGDRDSCYLLFSVANCCRSDAACAAPAPAAAFRFLSACVNRCAAARDFRGRSVHMSSSIVPRRDRPAGGTTGPTACTTAW